MIDCLLIGYNDGDFQEDVKRMSSMGKDSISYKDFNLGFIEHQGRYYRALDILDHFYYENSTEKQRPFHNSDVLWQVIMTLGTRLHKNGFSFDFINLFHLEKEKLKEKLLTEDILTIAITTTIYISIDPILEVIDFVKTYNKKAKIIIGGPYISKQSEEFEEAFSQSIYRLMDADFYIINLEGEQTLVNLLSEIKGKGDFKSVSNIAFRDGEEYIFTPSCKENNSLEDEMINYSLFPKDELRTTLNVRTSKSCPFSCAYCGFPLRAEKYSFVSVQRVEQELNAIQQIGSIRYINFIDDTFNIPKNRFKNILRMMIRNRYSFQWYSFFRVDYGDAEIIELMREAGCIGVFLGIESADNVMLSRMNKSARMEDFLYAIPLLKQAGIKIFASTIIGFPGETYNTALKTLKLIDEMAHDFFRPQIWWSDPLTPVAKRKDEFGIKGLGFNWVHNTMDAATAYDLFEKTFLSTENSVWVPDPGFNAYGMYYLMDRGMSVDRVKSFLDSFNAVVKDQLLNPEKKEIDPFLFDNLKRSSRFNEYTDEAFLTSTDYDGAAFKKSESYWVGKFLSNPPTAQYISNPDHSELKYYSLSLPVAATQNSEESSIINIKILTAFCAFVYDYDLNAHMNLLLHTSDGKYFCQDLKYDKNEPIKTFAEKLSYNIFESHGQAFYFRYFLKHPLRLKEYNCYVPSFQYAYFEGGGDPGLADGLKLILSVEENSCGFYYDSSCFQTEDLERFVVYLESLPSCLKSSDLVMRNLSFLEMNYTTTGDELSPVDFNL